MHAYELLMGYPGSLDVPHQGGFPKQYELVDPQYMLIHFQPSAAAFWLCFIWQDSLWLDKQFSSMPVHDQKSSSLNMLACNAVSAIMSLVKPHLGLAMTAQALCKATVNPWAAWYPTGLLISLAPKGVIFSFLLFKPQSQSGKEDLLLGLAGC